MKWSLVAGRFFGTEIRLHASLLLLIPYALLAFRPQDLAGMLRVLLLIAAVFACVALHEIGHTIAARAFGIQVTSIVLWPLGGFANLSRRPEKVLFDIIISAAGPLTNLLIFVFLAVATAAAYFLETTALFPPLAGLLHRWDAFPFLLGLTVANLSLALFNLVPIFPLDGGQIARGVLKMIFGERIADRMMLIISLPLALGLVGLGIAVGDVAVLLTGLLLVVAGASLNVRLLNGMMLGSLYFLDRGGYYLKRMDYDPAVQVFSRAIERSPNRAGLYVSRAAAYMQLMELEKAMLDADRAIALDAKNAVGWELRGELLVLQQKTAEALACFDRALEIRPQWSTGYADRAGVFMDLGDLPRALAEMDRAVELGRGALAPYLIRSMLRFKMGDLQGSRKDAEQAARYAPEWMLTFPEVFLSSLTGHLEWAQDYYARAVELHPGAYQAFQGRADAYRANGKWERAVEDYSRAAALAPRQAEIYLGRGRALQQLGLYNRAAADFRQAADLADRLHIRRLAQACLQSLSAAAATGGSVHPESSSSGGLPVSGEPGGPPVETA